MSTARRPERFKARVDGGVAYSRRTSPAPMPLLPTSVGACRRAALAIALALASSVLAAQPLTWGGRLGVASDWLVRGLRLSDGRAPVLIAGVDAYAAAGWSLGASALRLRDYLGERGTGWSIHLGHELPLDERWLLLADLEHSRYEGGPVLAGWGGTRLGLGLAYGDRWSLTWNADQPLDPSLVARSLDFNLRWPLARPLALCLGLGRVFRTPGERYSYGQAGLELHAGGLRLRLDRHWAQPAARLGYGHLAAPRWVGSAQWSF